MAKDGHVTSTSLAEKANRSVGHARNLLNYLNKCGEVKEAEKASSGNQHTYVKFVLPSHAA